MPSDIKHYIRLIRPTKPDFNNTMTEEDAAIMSEHFLYLQDLLKKDKLVLAGPCTDASFGISIYKVSSYEEAKSIADNDPAVKKGLVTFELKEYRISLFNPKHK